MWKYEVCMIPQPAVSSERLLELFRAGVVRLDTIVWTDGEGGNFRHFSEIRAEIEPREVGKETEPPTPFVPYRPSGPRLKYGAKPREHFERPTKSEELEEALEFIRKKNFGG